MEKKAFDRSRFKAAELSVIKKEEERADNMAKFGGGGNNNYTKYAKIEDGINEFRVLPAMDGSSPYVPFCTCNLEVEVDKYENGEVVGKEIRSKRIFDASVHSNVMGKKDPIELYISYVKKLAEQIQDTEEKKKFVAPLDWRSYKGTLVPGIKPTLNFICYVYTKDDNEIKRLILNEKWFKEINRISCRETSDSVITLDIFSDPDNGYPLIIERTKNDKGKSEYNISAKTPSRGQSWDDFFEENRIPDELLEKLSKLESLKTLYIDSYTERDWDLAMDGLKRFDEKHPEYNIFSDDEFLDELEELYKLVPSNKKEEKENNNSDSNQVHKEQSKQKTVEEKEEKKYPSVAKMKMFIRDYMEDKYPGVELPNLTQKELIEWYDLAFAEEDLPINMDESDENSKDFDQEEQTSEPESVIEEEKVNSSIPDDRMSRLEKIRRDRLKLLGKK